MMPRTNSRGLQCPRGWGGASRMRVISVPRQGTGYQVYPLVKPLKDTVPAMVHKALGLQRELPGGPETEPLRHLV